MRLSNDLSYDLLKIRTTIKKLPKIVDPSKFTSFQKVRSDREAYVAKEWHDNVTNIGRLGIGRNIDVRR